MKPSQLKISVFLIIALLSIPLIGRAQIDTLIFLNFSDLNFDNKEEGILFNKVLNNEKDSYFDILYLIGNTKNVADLERNKSSFQASLKQNEAKIMSAKTTKKKISYLFNSLHKTFFKKYELENLFWQIFDNGVYNCVSASALYALAFDNYNIPYAIKETPTHVYLVAYPDSDKILVESTDPSSGYIVANDKFKTDYISHLRKAKLISEEEFKSSNPTDLFEKYYFSKDNVTFKQLIGIQYMNDAFYHLSKDNYTEGVKQMEKAYMLYPSAKVKFWLIASQSEVLSKQDYSDKKNINLLIKLSHFDGSGIESEELLGEFGRMTETHFYNKSNHQYYDEIYNTLIAGIYKDSTRNEISYVYNYEKARYFLNKSNYTSALSFSEKAYSFRPENNDTQLLLTSSILSNVSKRNSPLEALGLLEEYLLKYAFLSTDIRFTSARLNLFAALMIYNYEYGKIKEGDKYKNSFEANYKPDLSIDLNQDLVARAYSSLAMYHFKLNNMAKAKSVIKKGLEYTPEHPELNRRLEILNKLK